MNRHLFNKSNFIVIFTFFIWLAVVFKCTFSFMSFLRMERYLFNNLNFIFSFPCNPISLMDRYLFQKNKVLLCFLIRPAICFFLDKFLYFLIICLPIVEPLMFFLRLILFRSLIFVSLL